MRWSQAVLGTVVSFAVGAGFVACGGPNPPPQTGASAPTSTAAARDSTAGAAEPPASPDLMAGIKAFDSGNYADARKFFEAAARKNPENYEAFHDLGLACERLGDKPAAEAAYKSALEVKPDLEGAAAELCALY